MKDVGNTPLRLGVIGLGRAAALMIPGLTGHPHVRLTAGADPNPLARERFEAEFGGRAYPDAEGLCAGGLVDAVYIATPHAQHAPDVLVAARYGKHVLVEKPMALTLADCRAMTSAAEQAGIAMVVGHTHGFNEPTAMMARLIRSGDFGRLRLIVNMVYTNFLYRPRRPEELDSALGGGIMYNQVPHQIELARSLATGQLERVRAVTGVWDPARPTEGALAAFLTFSDGAVAQLTYSGYDRFDTDEFHWWIGESGNEKAPDAYGATRQSLLALDGVEHERAMRVAMGYGGQGVLRSSGSMHEPHFGLLIASCEGADLRPSPDGVLIYGNDGVREIRTVPARVYPNKDSVIDEFYAAVVDGVPPVHDGAWATATTAAMLALVASARDGRDVAVAEMAAAP